MRARKCVTNTQKNNLKGAKTYKKNMQKFKKFMIFLVFLLHISRFCKLIKILHSCMPAWLWPIFRISNKEKFIPVCWLVLLVMKCQIKFALLFLFINCVLIFFSFMSPSKVTHFLSIYIFLHLFSMPLKITRNMSQQLTWNMSQQVTWNKSKHLT